MKKITRLTAYTLAFAMGMSFIPVYHTAGANKVSVKKVSVSDSITGNCKTITIAKGRTIKLTTAVVAKPDKSAYKKVSFKSKNTGIATVSSKGAVKGIKVGRTKIIVTSKKNSKKQAVINVKVVKGCVTNMKLDRKIASLNVGEKLKLKAVVKAGKGADKTIGWSSSKAKVAAVNSKGVVTALKGGTTTITAQSADGSGKKASCKITVNDKVDITDVKVIDPQTVLFTLSRAYSLAGENVAVYKKDYYEGEYRNTAVIESMTSTDNATYTISLDSFSLIRERQYVQVNIPSLSGKVKCLDTQYREPASAYTSEVIWEMMTGHYYDKIACFEGSEGMTDMSITGLPAGLTAVKKGVHLHVTGIPTTVGVTEALLTGVDELGNTWNKTIKIAVGSDTEIVGTAVTDYEIMGTNVEQCFNKEEMIKKPDGTYDYIYHEGYWKKETAFLADCIAVVGGKGNYIYELAPNGDPAGILQDMVSGVNVYFGVNGRFKYKVNQPGTYSVTVRVTEKDNVSDPSTWKSIDVTVPIKVAASITVNGKITDEQGEGMRGARVSFTNKNKAELYRRYQSTYTDINGDYSVNIVPGNYNIVVSYGNSGYDRYYDFENDEQSDNASDSDHEFEGATADKFIYNRNFTVNTSGFNANLPLYRVHINNINQTTNNYKDGKWYTEDMLKKYPDGSMKPVAKELTWTINRQKAGYCDYLYLKPGNYTLEADDYDKNYPNGRQVVKDGKTYWSHNKYTAIVDVVNSAVEVTPTTTLIEIPDSNNVILAPATDKKSDVKIVTTGRDTYEVKYCFANTAEDMIKWLAGPAETAEDGAFVNTAGHYKNAGYIYVPDKSVNNMVEVSSKNLYMMFYYNNNKKTIDIIPMSTEDIELCGNEGSIQYLMNRKNITLNKEENIYSYTDGLKTDKVIGISTWVKDSIIADGKNTDCLKLISKYNGGGESHIKVFVYNGHVINMEYRNVLDDTNDYDASFLDSVSFSKIAV